MSVEDMEAQLALEATLRGWQVHRAISSERWVRYKHVPRGHYWAAHWRLGEAPIVAADLETLGVKVRARNEQMAAEAEWAARSALSRIISRTPVHVSSDYPAELEGHLPRRPTWNCRGCGSPWPCETARDELGQALRRGELVEMMARIRGDAVIESGRSPAEISERFTSWIR